MKGDAPLHPAHACIPLQQYLRLSILHMHVFPYNSICVMEQENTQGILESTSVNCIQTKQLQFARKHLESVLPHLEVPVAP